MVHRVDLLIRSFSKSAAGAPSVSNGCAAACPVRDEFSAVAAVLVFEDPAWREVVFEGDAFFGGVFFFSTAVGFGFRLGGRADAADAGLSCRDAGGFFAREDAVRLPGALSVRRLLLLTPDDVGSGFLYDESSMKRTIFSGLYITLLYFIFMYTGNPLSGRSSDSHFDLCRSLLRRSGRRI
jgi:hypothetical protein